MTVYLSEFNNLFENDDATLAVIEALRKCREFNAEKLVLDKKELHFYERYAFNADYYISNNDSGRKSIVFPITNMKDFTVDGCGASLIFHGKVLPFVIDKSENIRLENFSVDYQYPFFFQGKIVSSDESFIELEVDKEHFDARVEGGEMVFTSPDGWCFSRKKLLNCEFDVKTGAPSHYIPPYIACFDDNDDGSFLKHMYRHLKPVQKSENIIRLEGNFGHVHNVGNYWVCTFCPRDNPGIFGNKTKNITIENVTLHATGSMGFICQLCENVSMKNLKTVPRENSGRMLSVNADSTHFVNCRGFVRYDGCTFLNMLDDAGNCHGNYLKLAKKLDAHTVLLSFGHPQQQGVNIFEKGDKIRIVDNMTMCAVAVVTVKSAELISKNFVRLETEEALPETKDSFAFENFTAMPELYINNCVCGANRPRGFLPSTWKKTVITNNTFYNMSCALHFTGDCNDWFESGPSENVTVKNNNFRNSAYAGGAAICITPNVKNGDKPYHRNITIEDNVFEMHEKRFIVADRVENLTVRNNRFVLNEALPSHGAIGENGMSISKTCVNVKAEELREI